MSPRDRSYVNRVNQGGIIRTGMRLNRIAARRALDIWWESACVETITQLMSHISTGVQGPAESSVMGWMTNVTVFATLPLPQFPSLAIHSAVMVGVVVQELGQSYNRGQVRRAGDSEAAWELSETISK